MEPDQDTDRDRHPGFADPDPADPDRYQFGAHVFFTFFLILKIMTHLPLMRKEKRCELTLL